jgi:hypothetical protein
MQKMLQVQWGDSVRMPDGKVVTGRSLRLSAKNGKEGVSTVEHVLPLNHSVKLPDGSVISPTCLRMIAE